MKKQFILFYFFTILLAFSLQNASAVLFGPNTLDDTLIRSNGLNTTINISNFTVTFSTLIITSSSINFTNLVYVNPLSCGLRQSYYPSYNYNTPNQTFELPPETECLPPSGGGIDTGGGGGGTWDIETITLDHINVTWDNFNFEETSFIYIQPLDKYEKIVNISNLTINIKNVEFYTEGDLIKLTDWRYKKSYNINKQKNYLNFFTISISAVQGSKNINKIYNIPISNKKESIIENIKNKKLFIILISILILIIIALIAIKLLLKKRIK